MREFVYFGLGFAVGGLLFLVIGIDIGRMVWGSLRKK
jgi:hypothetical protein